MKGSYRGLPTFVWALLGVLAVSAALLSLGERDDDSRPAADSYSPSGTAAMVALLKTNGYDVRVDRWPHPRLQPGDVAIACYVIKPNGLASQSPSVDESSGNAIDQESSDFDQYMRKQVQGGVGLIELSMPGNFLAASRNLLTAGPSPVVPRGKKTALQLDLTAAASSAPISDNPSSALPSVGLWDVQHQPVLRAYRDGAGRVLSASDATFATNRFIDKHDNARAVVEMVGMLAPPGSHLVFTEASYGNVVPPSLMETIGPWAYAGWQQMLLLGLVVVFTLGKRFGIPDESRPIQRGSRELLDALADTYLRGRQTHAAMQSALDRCESELRTALRLPRDAAYADLLYRLPGELGQALTRLRQASAPDISIAPREALALAAKARTQTDAFLNKRRHPGNLGA